MRGRIPFSCKGVEYLLQFTTNRLCLLEEETGRSVMAFAKAMESAEGMSYKDLRCLFRAGVHPQITLEQAGEIMDEVGMAEVGDMIGRAMAAAFGADEAKGAKGSKNPRTAAT